MSAFYTNPLWWTYLVMFVPFATLTFRYGLSRPRLWVHEPLGRGFLLLLATLTLVLGNAVIGLALPDGSPIRAVMRVIFLSGGIISGYYLWYTYERLRREERPQEPSRRERASAS